VRFMMLVKADRTTEAGTLPKEKDLAAMGAFNQELINAGALVDAAGLQPSSKGAKVTFQNGRAIVTDGPFAETKEIIAGYWVIDVKSRAEAIEWAKRVPFAHLPGDGRVPEIEVRQFFDLADFPEAPANVVEMEKSFRAGAAGGKR
jgi:hypothetical protein